MTEQERTQGIGAADFHWPYPMEGGYDSSAGHVYAQAIRGANEMRRRAAWDDGLIFSTMYHDDLRLGELPAMHDELRHGIGGQDGELICVDFDDELDFVDLGHIYAKALRR